MDGKLNIKFRDIIGLEAFAFTRLFTILVLGWPLYLIFGVTGAPKRGFTSHFIVPNKLFPPRMLLKVGFSNLGLGIFIYILYLWAQNTSFTVVMALYGGPYLIVNMWLTGYTWLQHSDETVPHYDEYAWDWVKGALATIDRNYPNYINTLHYNIGSTHVLHHLFSYIPHYHAYEATLYLKELLGDTYRFD